MGAGPTQLASTLILGTSACALTERVRPGILKKKKKKSSKNKVLEACIQMFYFIKILL